MNYKRIYIENSLLFITLVTNNRSEILINSIEIIKQALFNVQQIYKFELIAYSVLPDHIHCIIKPENISEYPKIIKSFKYSFTKNVGLVKPTYKGSKIWQNRYWEHTIRDEDDLYRHIDYIHYNPMKHYNIAPKDWEFSSFHKYVKNNIYEKNWCNFEDRNKIAQLNFE